MSRAACAAEQAAHPVATTQIHARPGSAASTAALSASRLVWRAICRSH
jgi:hypothetical protein